jgi:phosphatidylglycerophosphatase A
MRYPHKLIATLFYAGRIPFAPGTAGSALAFLFYLAVKGRPSIMAAAILLSAALGFISSGRVEALSKKKDPGCIVIDEFTGMLIALFLVPRGMVYAAAGFILFRFFDVIKIQPIKKMESLEGSKGIMLDDIAAGLYTNLILQIAGRLF